MLFEFVNNGSDNDTVEYLEKALPNPHNSSLVLKDVVAKNGKTVKRWCKVGTDQIPKRGIEPRWNVKTRDAKDKRRPQTNNTRTKYFYDIVDSLFYDTKTPLGTDIQFINHKHLDERRIERRLNNPNVLQDVKAILKNPVGVHIGKNVSGTTEYYGFERGHEGDPNYGIVAVVLDNYEPTGKGQLQTIMVSQRINTATGKIEHTGLNKTHRDILMNHYNNSKKGHQND